MAMEQLRRWMLGLVVLVTALGLMALQPRATAQTPRAETPAIKKDIGIWSRLTGPC
jgi:hypothetical protein